MPRSVTRSAATVGRGPLAAAVRAAVAAHVGQVDRVVLVGVAAVAAVLGVGGVLELGQRERVVLDAEVGDVAARSRPRSATSGSSAFRTNADSAVAARRRPRPSGRRSARARRSGRAGRGTGWPSRNARGSSSSATRGSHASSTSNSPSSPGWRARRRAARWPRPSACSSPARLRTTGRPACSRMPASSDAVVVLPLVAEISTAPPSSRLPSRPIAPRSSRSSTRPGAVVPPLPRRRVTARISRASAVFRPNIRLGRYDDPQAARLDRRPCTAGRRSGRRRRRSRTAGRRRPRPACRAGS